MTTKTKAARPKAKTKPKTKSKAKANSEVSPEANSLAFGSPETAVQSPAIPDDITKQDFAPLRARQADLSVRDVAEMLKILADQTRIMVVMLIQKSPGITVGDIVKNGSASQPATSHHLALLRHSGLVFSDRDGKHCRYSLTDKGQVAAGLLATMME